MKRKISIAATLVLFAGYSFACPVCKKQQPDILKGVAHGSGPQNEWDYIIVIIAMIIVIVTLYYSVKWILRPGEKERKHIKYSILNLE